MRDADLIDLDAGTGGRRVERRDQSDDRRLLAHAVRPYVLLAGAQDSKTKLAVFPLVDPLLILAALYLSTLLRHLQPEQIAVKVQRTLKIPDTQGNMRRRFSSSSQARYSPTSLWENGEQSRPQSPRRLPSGPLRGC